MIGKTTSKKALSCTRLQEGENPKLGRNSTCLNLFASARPTYMNVGPKLGLEANQIFLFNLIFSNRKLNQKNVTQIKIEINFE